MANFWLSATEKITATTGIINFGNNEIQTTNGVRSPLIELADDTTIGASEGNIIYSVAAGKKNSFLVDSNEVQAIAANP